MSNYEETKYDFSGSNIEGLVGVSSGSVVPWSDSSIPSGFLECNGQSVSRSTYATLFAIIGTTYGAGNGSTTYDLPDLQDKVIVGKSNNKALASTGGADTVQATGNISGSAGNTTIDSNTLASHPHPSSGSTGGGNGAHSASTGGGRGFYRPLSTVGTNPSTGSEGGGGSHGHNAAASFTGDSTSVLQPYLTVIYIIKT